MNCTVQDRDKLKIAIDGPSGAGKSTIAKALAKHFGITYADTGALYRVVALKVLRENADPGNMDAVTGLLSDMDIELRLENGCQRMLLCGEDVTDKLRTEQVSKAASAVSAIPAVRSFLLNLQQNIAKRGNVIMDGRDIGTKIMPDANIKIFLTATSEDRARRRYEELLQRGEAADFEKVLGDLKKRDENDSTRLSSPLRPAPDAILVDTTGYELETSIKVLRELVEKTVLI